MEFNLLKPRLPLHRDVRVSSSEQISNVFRKRTLFYEATPVAASANNHRKVFKGKRTFVIKLSRRPEESQSASVNLELASDKMQGTFQAVVNGDKECCEGSKQLKIKELFHR